jgi:putative peptide zinc metalloprotease protein
MKESAFINPPWLLEREGSGYVQVTELLYRIAECCDGASTVDDIAARITASGKPVSPATISRLIAQLLIPRGLVEMADGSVVPVASGPVSPLALNMRMKMVGPERIMPITNILRGLYWPPVMVAVLAIAAFVEVWVYVIHGIGASLRDAIYAPGLMGIILLVIVVSAGFHELGHAAALHYAGGRIKGMGAGIYIVYPAFFTDVSDNYRLTRWKRVRTDLGGFYFNLIFSLVIMGVYVLTGLEWLLLLVLLINLEILHQLLPFLRLDGYWTLADITGVPDFFTQMAAFVRSVLPVAAWKGRKLPPLKRWATVVFAIYTLITIPLLVLLVVLMIRSVPRVLATAWDSFGQQGHAFVAAQAGGSVLAAAGAAVQAVLLLIPTIGLLYTLFAFGRRLVRLLWAWGRPNLARRGASVLGMVAAAGLVGFMWIPQVSVPGAQPSAGTGSPSTASAAGIVWQPIGPEDRGVVQDVVAPAPTPQATVAARPTVAPTAAVPVSDVQSRATPQPTLQTTPTAQVQSTSAPTPRALQTTPTVVRALATSAPTPRATVGATAAATPAATSVSTSVATSGPTSPPTSAATRVATGTLGTRGTPTPVAP